MFLKQHSEIIVVNSDKDNRAVVMHREDYVSKIEGLLEDST